MSETVVLPVAPAVETLPEAERQAIGEQFDSIVGQLEDLDGQPDGQEVLSEIEATTLQKTTGMSDKPQPGGKR